MWTVVFLFATVCEFSSQTNFAKPRPRQTWQKHCQNHTRTLNSAQNGKEPTTVIKGEEARHIKWQEVESSGRKAENHAVFEPAKVNKTTHVVAPRLCWRRTWNGCKRSEDGLLHSFPYCRSSWPKLGDGRKKASDLSSRCLRFGMFWPTRLLNLLPRPCLYKDAFFVNNARHI